MVRPPPVSRATLAPLLALAAAVAGCSGNLVSSPGFPAGDGTAAADGPPGKGPVADEPGSIGMTTAPLDCSAPHVAATPLQRLSRAQLKRSVRDLLKVDVDLTALSEDEKVGVFAGNTVAPITDLQVDEYAAIAQRAASQAKLEALVSCDRAAQGDAKCAAQFIDKVGLRTYRRPLSADEKASYVALFEEVKGNGYADALRVIVQSMLQSPHFLYRVELQPTTASTREGAALDAYELASRLSFFLLGTTPDDALLESARTGELSTEAGLDAAVKRLMTDARFTDTLADFHRHWLELDQLDTLTRDSTLFPSFSPALADAMLDDTTKFVDHVFRNDGKLDTLLTASIAFPNDALAKLYGVSASSGAPVALDPKQRAGLLTQPAFLAAHAHYNQTSPVARGKVVIRNVLCQQLPDPPANVNTTPPDPSPNLPLRQQLLEHRADASCAGCHKRIDGIGLGFESFDAIGAYRAKEAGKDVDASGEVVNAGTASGTFKDSIALVHQLAASDEVQQCVAAQWLRFALGRLEADADACSKQALFRDFAASDHDLRVLLRAIVASDAFQLKRVGEGKP